jgi:hypothetical protein
MRFSRWSKTLVWLLLAVADGAAARAEDVKRVCVTASTAGQTQRDEGKLLEAREQLLRCAREDCPDIVKTHCAGWLADIESQIPSIVVRVLDTSGNDRTDVRTSVDGKQMKLDGKPTPLDPGEHVIAVETAEGARKEQKVLVVVREKGRLLTIQVTSASAAEPGETSAPPKVGAEPSGPLHVPLGAYVVGGVGAVALGTGIYFGLTARSDFDRLKDECAPRCNPSDGDSARRKAIISDVSLGIGAAAVVGGVAWAIFGSKRGSPASTALGAFPVAGGWVATLSSQY